MKNQLSFSLVLRQCFRWWIVLLDFDDTDWLTSFQWINSCPERLAASGKAATASWKMARPQKTATWVVSKNSLSPKTLAAGGCPESLLGSGPLPRLHLARNPGAKPIGPQRLGFWALFFSNSKNHVRSPPSEKQHNLSWHIETLAAMHLIHQQSRLWTDSTCVQPCICFIIVFASAIMLPRGLKASGAIGAMPWILGNSKNHMKLYRKQIKFALEPIGRSWSECCFSLVSSRMYEQTLSERNFPFSTLFKTNFLYIFSKQKFLLIPKAPKKTFDEIRNHPIAQSNR